MRYAVERDLFARDIKGVGSSQSIWTCLRASSIASTVAAFNQYLLVTKRSGKSYDRLSRITCRLVGITTKRQIGLWRAIYKAEIQLTTLLRFVFDFVTLTDNLMMMFFRTAAIFLIFAMQSAHAAQLDGEANQTSFVANQTCEGCHPAQYQAWSQSHHAQAMQEATAASVKGDFDNSQFEHFGVESRFLKKDGEFVVNTEGPDGKLRDYVVKYTFGIDPLQQYLIEFPGGRLQSLTIAWDTRSEDEGGQRWFHLYPDEKIAPDDPTRDPAMMSSELLSEKPMPAAAHPE